MLSSLRRTIRRLRLLALASSSGCVLSGMLLFSAPLTLPQVLGLTTTAALTGLAALWALRTLRFLTAAVADLTAAPSSPSSLR